MSNRYGNNPGIINAQFNFTCGRNPIMGDIVTFAAPYLYPFVVEYSIIASAVIYAMWSSIGSNPRYSSTLHYICLSTYARKYPYHHFFAYPDTEAKTTIE